jgi:hypothetical protein
MAIVLQPRQVLVAAFDGWIIGEKLATPPSCHKSCFTITAARQRETLCAPASRNQLQWR